MREAWGLGSSTAPADKRQLVTLYPWIAEASGLLLEEKFARARTGEPCPGLEQRASSLAATTDSVAKTEVGLALTIAADVEALATRFQASVSAAGPREVP